MLSSDSLHVVVVAAADVAAVAADTVAPKEQGYCSQYYLAAVDS